MYLQPTPEEIIQNLLEIHPSEIAFLSSHGRIYYSSLHFESYRPMSALSTLIQGIYEKYPTQARSMLRNRIYSTAPASAMDFGMVKVAAKRLTAPISPPETSSKKIGFSYDKSFIHFTPPPEVDWPFQGFIPKNQSEVIDTIQNLSQKIYRSFHLYESDRPIAALLVSKEEKILAWGINSSSKNKTLHAEVNLLQSFYLKTNTPLPVGCKLYTTLKPCKMCAGMIWASAIDPTSIQVLYLDEDLGPMAQQTVLDLNTLDRKRISKNKNELAADILKKIT